ncbi:hypothetical protein HCU40_05830 [Pseudanabaena biceps]|nr:hypothetical protein [Pseudanabaena biceps]
MQRSQWISVFTGIVAVILGLGYLILVQVLDWRGGEMLPAPVDLSRNLPNGLETVVAAASNLLGLVL